VAVSPMVPAGRLVRLGVVLDASSDGALVERSAVLAERAGIDALWLAPLTAADPPPSDVLLDRLGAAARNTTTLVLGAFLETVPASVPAALQGRLEATVPAAALGARLAPAGLCRVDPWIPDPAGEEPGRFAYRNGGQTAQAGELVVVPAAAVPAWPPTPVPLAVVASCSIGRTSAEARARADADPLFAVVGHPAAGGVFGTLEECQERVVDLARCGVVDVRCVLPACPDVHDVIAQLSAVATGTLDVLGTGGRSAAPPPPEGWGGRRHPFQ